MKFRINPKLLGGILSAIVLGAIGSGVWQYVLEPVLSKSSSIILELATLGKESFQNELYRGIAKGFHESASNRLDGLFNLLFSEVILFAPVFLIFGIRDITQRKAALLEDLQRIESGDEPKSRSVDELRKQAQRLKPERLARVAYLSLFFGIILLPVSLVTRERDQYVNSAITHYLQLERVVSPYLDRGQLKQLDSRFAQIQSANDYEAIISQMNSIAKHHGAKIPEFEVWK